MEIRKYPTSREASRQAAMYGARELSRAIQCRDEACAVLATGASQFEMYEALVQQPVDWSAVTAFALDEYLGLSADHPACFRRYLEERFVSKVSRLKAFQAIDGTTATLEEECRRLAESIAEHPVDVAFLGIGENGHIAFNDPPADFTIDSPYLIVSLDRACRRQQFAEGWFLSIEAVPSRAISMSITQIMKSRLIVCTVPEERKAVAVRNALEGPVTNLVPASILQRHPRCRIFLDEDSARLLSETAV
jgi:glucosamine-6-phosphate deaminase